MSDIRPGYKTPEVVTYSDSDILKQMPVKVMGGPYAPQSLLEFSTEDNSTGRRAIRHRSLLGSSLFGDDE